ncbi:S-layer homology domain-containing protein [Meiothermus sp. Pnk-1]|uniref:S-layer homology domain-containing protein n=1 Tax=Meiothermus sp. Pnk-1 TaxID=873128 RepID=UPI000D7BFEAF|nr:S-layer homology domain-containing protein [Meiothermus sp. Pnk-1]PZA07434.1 S-layer protein [Meiothermus sp. Pnk-1]
MLSREQRSRLAKTALSVWSASLGLALAQQAPFTDVPPTLEDIRFLYQKGIVQGYPDGTFRGREYMTRYQAAAMLYRAYLVFADDVARRVREALAQDSQARLEEAFAAIRDLQEALKIVQEAMADYPEVRADLEETRKNVEGLAEELAQVSSQMVTREEIGDLMASVGALEGLIQRGEEGLKALQARVNVLEGALRDLEGRIQAGQGELNKKVFDLGGRVDALEKGGRNRPKLSVGGSVGLSDGQPDGEVFVRGEANGVRLAGRVNPDGVQVRAEGGGLTLEHVQKDGLSESRAGYRLFEGVALGLEVGYGDSTFGVARLIHEPDGGLIPGVVAEAGAGAGFHEGSLSRNLLFVRAGYRFGGVTPSLGYWRYQGEEPYSLLEGRLDWQADFGSLGGYYRLVAFPGSGNRGSEWGVRFTSSANPFVELGVRGTEGLVAGEPGSFSFRYQNATASRTDFTVRVGYRLEF